MPDSCQPYSAVDFNHTDCKKKVLLLGSRAHLVFFSLLLISAAVGRWLGVARPPFVDAQILGFALHRGQPPTEPDSQRDFSASAGPRLSFDWRSGMIQNK